MNVTPLTKKRSAGMLGIWFCLYLLSGCAAHPSHNALKNAHLPELIQRDKFFDFNGAAMDHQVSPDGKKLAWLTEHQGNLTIFFRTIAATEKKKINTRSWCNVNWFTWAQDSRHLLFTLDVGPNSAQHIYQSDSKYPDKKPVDLTPGAKSLALFKSGIPSDSETILVTQDKRENNNYELFKVNLTSGLNQLMGKSRRSVVEWITDHKGTLKGRIRADDKGLWHLEQYNLKTSGWFSLAVWGPDEYIQNYGVTPDGKGLWLLSNKYRDRISLVRFDLESGKEILVCRDPEADVEDVYISPVSGKALFAYSYPDYPKTWVLDPDLKADLKPFGGNGPNGFRILGMDDAENFITVMCYDNKERSYYLYDRTTHQKRLLGTRKWQLEDGKFADTRPVAINARDQRVLQSFLTLPCGAGLEPLPMVLLVHGGPWARDYWQPDAMVQFLANRGYAVLQVNYRGSTGYGRAHKEAAKKEFAQKMHNDLIDAVNWAINHKIADSDNIAIVGGSYGGYAALAGMTFTPDVFACAIAINGVFDLAQVVGSLPSNPPLYEKRGIQIWYDYVGDPKNPRAIKDMKQRSPLFFADRVKKPVLIIFGQQDKIVTPVQSVNMINDLKKRHKKVTFKRFDNEGHGFSWIHNSLEMYQMMEKFLARHLGGRYEK